MDNVINNTEHKLSDNSLCKGWVNHSRLTPKKHDFNYPVFMFYLNIDTVSQVLSVQAPYQRFCMFKPWVWKRDDYFDGTNIPLREAIDHWLSEQDHPPSAGPITMLTNVRCFGYLINPITVYFLFDSSGERLDCMIAEVTNTPWRERKIYLISGQNGDSVKHAVFNKEMHVSPFHEMGIEYQWRSQLSEKNIEVSIGCRKHGSLIFNATLSLSREKVSVPRLKKTLREFPIMTVKVAWGIYWQAAKLFVKRIPMFPHPKSVK